MFLGYLFRQQHRNDLLIFAKAAPPQAESTISAPDLFRTIFDLASQILNSPVALFLLYTTCIVKRAYAMGEYGYDCYRPVKRAVSHKSRQMPNAVQTIRSGTFSNKLHTGRYTAKQRVYCSQYRFWLSLTIAEHKHNLQTPLNTGYRLQTATNAQHRANTFGRVLTLLSSTNRTQGDTRRNRVLTSLFT